MALRTRASDRPAQSRAPSRLGSLRMVLLLLALVPSIAVAALWAVSSERLYADWRTQRAQNTLAYKAGFPSNLVYFNLQQERRLSAAALADPKGSRDALLAQRQRTDQAVAAFQSLSGIQVGDAPRELRDAVATTRKEMGRLADFRSGVDRHSATQQATFAYYTDLIETDLQLFNALSDVDNGQLGYMARPLVDAFWAKEMLSREDAMLSRIAPGRALDVEEHRQLTGWIGAQDFTLDSRVAPYLTDAEQQMYTALTESSAWQGKDSLERTVVHARTYAGGTKVYIPAGVVTQWRGYVDQIDPELQQLIQHRTLGTSAFGDDSVAALKTRLIITSAVGLAGVLVVVLISVRLTTTLRRRVFSLRDQALRVQSTLPALVDRLSTGETVDLSGEFTEVRRGRDELSRLEEALDQARRTAMETALRQAEQHRGFERLLQRIARRTQLLIGLQLKKLNEMEHRHEDPEVLEGLFDLDHLTARLRRYEENLVILGGGQPQRRWRKPVRLLDVLRAAQGEVQDYRRVHIEVEGRPWLAERAVGPVVHVLAELMENAVSFSKPPTPVEVRAGTVGRGVAVEIEDRGLGMEPEQLAEANAMMADPPEMDVVTRADDARLGLYVVARLAATLELRVEFRASAFGGTRVIVLIPAELGAVDPDTGPVPAAAEPPVLAVVPQPEEAPEGTLPEDIEEDVWSAGREDFSELVSTTLDTFTRRTGETVAPAAPAGAAEPPGDPAGTSADGLPSRSRGRAMAEAVAARTPEPAVVAAAPPAPDPVTVAVSSGAARAPLPKRVRQASLVDELREPAARPADPSRDTLSLRAGPTRFGPAIGAFQRQSRIARQAAGTDDQTTTGASAPEANRPRTEDRG
ncbi:nitrate- and nitrite sensing domain-containing protein [Peterkaempfera sp. SMS 1(5)a]|uniref:sensor histidine kinase n=1 Tax=Peterkaempfera podocarpi TaxID=3232308 RepID=UPI00366B986D